MNQDAVIVRDYIMLLVKAGINVPLTVAAAMDRLTDEKRVDKANKAV